MLVIAIKNLEMHLGNSNPPLGKNTTWFKPSAQKR